MKKRKAIRWKNLVAALVLMVSLGFFVAPMVSAVDNCGTTTFFNWGCEGASEGERINSLLFNILNWMAVGVTVVVVGGVIFGAIMYTSSGGNPEQAKKALGTIRNAVIALFMYFAMWALLNWLIPGGVFN